MKTIAMSFLAVVLTACGSDDASTADSGTQSAGIELASSIQTNTKTIGIKVLAPRDSDDLIVTCTSLLSGNPADERYTLLQGADFAYPPADGSQTLTLTDVKENDGALVYVNARNSSNTVIGEGCSDSVSVKNGETEDVTIIVYPAS